MKLKSNGVGAGGLIALMACFLLSGGVNAAKAADDIARVLTVKGQARYSDDSKIWQDLRTGTVLKPGSVIQTSVRSVVEVQLGLEEKVPGSKNRKQSRMIRVYENSVVAIDRLTVDARDGGLFHESQLDLRAGQMLAKVPDLHNGSTFEVKIPNGAAGVTQQAVFLIAASGVVETLNGGTVLAIVDGDGSVKTRKINTWQRFDPTTGQTAAVPDTERAAWKKDL